MKPIRHIWLYLKLPTTGMGCAFTAIGLQDVKMLIDKWCMRSTQYLMTRIVNHEADMKNILIKEILGNKIDKKLSK
jgi:hypothetical protein